MLRHLPNFICLVRIALIWPTIEALVDGNYWTALVLVAVCAVSDGLDGWLAKRFNWTSHLGKILDPLADKLLLVALFLTATWINLVPWWLTAIVVARDVMIGGGAVIYRLWFGPLYGRPTILSKINTGMQLAVALAAILGAACGLPTPGMVLALAFVTLITTVASGADYLTVFTRRALATQANPMKQPTQAAPF
jgi:cardiolipin synthase